MSKGVQDRIQLSHSVIVAGYVYAQVAAEAWQRRRREFCSGLSSPAEGPGIEQWLGGTGPQDGHSAWTLADLFRYIASAIEEATEAMIGRDETLARCEVDLHSARLRRDQAAACLARCLREARRQSDSHRSGLRNGG